MHKVIIVPGLGDRVTTTSWATKRWNDYGLEPIVHPVFWRNGEAFQIKLERFLRIVDEQVMNGGKVSLIGCSAGASAVLNAFYERKNQINKVISICGRLKAGNQKGCRSLRTRAKSSPAFEQSVKLFESRQGLLSEQDRKRIMTVRARFGDELVPADTSTLEGAYNLTIPTIEHTVSIYGSLTLFSSRLVTFLLKK
jgi:hypothetical protein